MLGQEEEVKEVFFLQLIDYKLHSLTKARRVVAKLDELGLEKDGKEVALSYSKIFLNV